MTSRPQPAARRQRRTGAAVVRGLLSLAAIMALLVGIPLALLAIAGNPLPQSLPALDDVTSALTSPDDGTLFLTALVVVAWLGWVSFAIGVLVEIPAALSGRKAPRIPILRVQQRAASGLVTAVAAMFVVGPASIATATDVPDAHDSSPQAVAPQVNAAAQQAEPEPEPEPEQSRAPAEPASSAETQNQRTQEQSGPAERVHVVRSGESLWKIADEQLGDGSRWPEIAKLNYDVQQADGTTLDKSHWVAPGWRLTLPADPESGADTSEAQAQAEQTDHHVVSEGDTLWDIAEDRLGDGSRYPELFEASRDIVQPDGRTLSDPDLIVPGWRIAIPGTQPPNDEKPPTDEKPPVDEEPPTDDEPPVDEEPPVGEEPPVDEDANADEEADDETEEVGGPGQTPADAEESDFPVRTAAGVGSLLAAGVLGYLALKRRSQQRHRAPGERIAMPDGAAAATERELRGVADPLSVETVDRALRGLALHCTRRGVPLPPVRIGRLTAEQFELYLTEPAELPEPFVATEQDHVWFLPATAERAFSNEELDGVAAPYPSLVTVGHGPEDGHLLLDLERLGTLTLTGPDGVVSQVMAALAVELATSPWADDLQVTLVGTCPELADGLDTGRVRHLPSVGSLLDDLSRRADNDRAALSSSGAGSLDDARPRGVAAAAWTPEIVLLAHELSAEQYRTLTGLVDSMPRVAVAAVTHERSAVGAWSLELDDSDPDLGVLQPVSVEVSPQRLDDEQYRRILDLLGIAEEAAAPATGSSVPSPPNPPGPPLDDDTGPVPEDIADIAAQTPLTVESTLAASAPSAQPEVYDDTPFSTADAVTAGPTVLLLGPVDVENAAGPLEQSKYRQLTEIAAYIALHPGLSHSALDEAMWPGSRVTQNTRNTAISKLRRWFGRDESGEDYLPRVDTGYRFHPGVSTDWELWLRWVGADPKVAGTDGLVSALELVRGQPFTGVNPRRYAWAEHLKQEMISAIVDVAHEVAQRGLQAGDAHLARKAATIGLQAEPGMEVLWRDRIKSEHLAGNRSGIDEAVARLTAISDELGDELEDDTNRLIEELLTGRSGGAPALSTTEMSGRL